MSRTPLSPFADSLISSGPHRDVPEAQRIFAPFIGDWDLIVKWFDEKGKLTRQERGEWHFSWILEGRGIQDIWIVPPRDERLGHGDLYEFGPSDLDGGILLDAIRICLLAAVLDYAVLSERGGAAAISAAQGKPA